MGGLNIINPVLTADRAYSTSRKATSLLIDSIKGLCGFSTTDHYDRITQTRHRQFTQELHNTLWSDIFDHMDLIHQRCLLRNQKSLSTWLTALPISKDGFNLSSYEFRDALCVRYLKPLTQLPSNCDGCGSPFTTSHALDCRKGGLVIQRHNYGLAVA